MKYVFMLLTSLVLLSCGGNNKVVVGNKTTMEVEELFDAGNVMKGEMITAKFQVHNTGDYPLVIGEVKGSCSCTVASYPEEPIAPGKVGEVLAHVNTEKTGTGVINKTIRIVANTDPSVTQVAVRANVSHN